MLVGNKAERFPLLDDWHQFLRKQRREGDFRVVGYTTVDVKIRPRRDLGPPARQGRLEQMPGYHGIGMSNR
jgi:hypothetical protein